jgi:shikimate dehydrogenase
VEHGARVTVLNRTEARARELARALDAEAAGPLEALADLPYDILVNATRVGLASDATPVPADRLRSGAVVMDAVYEPERTRLLRDAEARGAIPVGGKWMLVHQAAEQLRLWCGQDPPIDTMADAFDRVKG